MPTQFVLPALLPVADFLLTLTPSSLPSLPLSFPLTQTKVPQKELVFGKVFSDHMLEIDWDDEKVRTRRES